MMEFSMFKYSLSCYLDPKVFKERKEELMTIPKKHQEAFLDMIVSGYSVDRAQEECGKLAEVSGRYGIAPGNIIRAMRRVEYEAMVSVELNDFKFQSLNNWILKRINNFN